MDSNALDNDDLSGQASAPALSLPLKGGQYPGSVLAFGESTKQSDISGRRKMYPKEQWLALRPIIQQLYVDEGQIFLKVAEYLHEHHDFNPTKKQFLRRISEWGFQKNIKRDERRTILESLGDSVKEVEFEPKNLRGRRLDKAKIARWKRREMISGESCVGIENSSEISDGELNLRGGDCSSTLETQTCNHDEIVEEIHRPGVPPGLTIGDQAQFFNPWLVVDVVGSPDLTRLIGALTLDLCEEIPDFVLEAPYSHEIEDEVESRNSKEDSGIILSEEGDNSQQSSRSVSDSVATLLLSFSQRSRYRIPTPFDELYPLPQFAPKSVYFIEPKTDHLMSSYALTKQELECRRRFKALKKMAPQEIMDLVEDMRTLAWRHYELGNYHCEEVWWRRFINASLKIPWHQPLHVLRACLSIIEILLFYYKHTEARSLHEHLHPKILKLVRPDHDLAIFSRQILATLMTDEDSEAEVRREMLQMCLINFGPRYWATLDCLSDLGLVLLRDGKYQAAETITYIHLQLDRRPLNHGEARNERLSQMSLLAEALSRQQRFEDCANVLSATESLFGAGIRFNDHLCWLYYIQKARVLKYLGRGLETEDILRNILRHARDYSNSHISVATEDLVNLLKETNRLAEAIIWQEKMLLMDEEIYGFQHQVSQTNCENLGLYYANLGRYEDAIAHYQRTAGKVALIQTENIESRDGYIEDIRGWISKVERWKEKQAKTVELQRIIESMPPEPLRSDLN